jgi:hypothetical protein
MLYVYIHATYLVACDSEGGAAVHVVHPPQSVCVCVYVYVCVCVCVCMYV